LDEQYARVALMEQLNTRASLLDAVKRLHEDIERIVAEAGEERMAQPGSFGELMAKDVIVHLTSWRLTTAARLETGLRGEDPVFPWPAHLHEDNDTDEINRWFFDTNYDKPLASVMRDSDETFERVERAIAALPEDDLLLPDRFPWMERYPYPLGPAVVSGTIGHHDEHLPEIREWLARG
jgi:hypothetical protein